MRKKTFKEMVSEVRSRELRGSAKLRAALDAFGIDVEGRTALDIGASTGGFVTELLRRGAARVYAVDAGHGQLLGSLRQDPRVVNLERTNVGGLTSSLVPDPIEVVTVDVSYLSLSAATAQLNRVNLVPAAHLVGLVKPMFELGLAQAPTDQARLKQAIDLATTGIERTGWTVVASIESPVRGAKGAIEGFVRASKSR